MSESRRHLLLKQWGPLAYVLGMLLLVVAATMILPIGASLIYQEGDFQALALSALITACCGAPLAWFFRSRTDLQPKQALAAATIGWIVVSALSGLPFIIHGSIPSFTDAFFEMMSGYTTTGATILSDIESLPHGLLLWRSETHLIGGMGFVTLAVLLLPHGMGGLRLFRAESSPGQVLTRERISSRNRDAMYILWGIYLGLNALQIVMMMLGGMSLFDAMCHAFGTISTSGYSPYNSSIGHYDNAYFDWVITFFMFCGGVSFILFFYVIHGDWKKIWTNTELRWYVIVVLGFCLFTTLILWQAGTYDFANSARHGFFQIMSILTTTGYTTTDYEQWPSAAQMLVYAVAFIGACTGSTSSGIKIAHYVIIFKFMSAFVKKSYFQPLTVVSVRLNGERIENSIIHLALLYFAINIVIVVVGGLVMSLSDGMDIISATTSVVASLMNIGPGFGQVGPSHNFGFISDFGKWFLSMLMLAGRLEMFSALVLLYPSFWRG